MTAVSSETIVARLAKLQALLAQREVDVAVLQLPGDLYYFTGSVQPLYLLVPREGQSCVLARKALTRIRAEVTALPLYAFDGAPELIAILEQTGMRGARRLGFTLDLASYASVQRFQRLCPGAEIVDLAWDLRLLRMVKSAEEIARQRQSGEVLARLPAWVHAIFTPGITELQLSAGLEYQLRLVGNDALIRCRREGTEMSGSGVCVSGVNTLAGTKFEGICGGVGLSPAVPYGATRTPIAEGAPILLDFAFVQDGYHLDQTRMACWGRPSDAIQHAYAAMLEVEEAIFARLRPGTPWQDVYQHALAHATALGYADTFMGAGSEQVSFVGHGVGLELDEPPFLAPRMPYPLAAGMTIAIEPKVALPGIGIVGVEDTVVVRDGEPEVLTICPREIMVVG